MFGEPVRLVPYITVEVLLQEPTGVKSRMVALAVEPESEFLTVGNVEASRSLWADLELTTS